MFAANNTPCFDAVIIGSGISGITSAFYFQKHNPGKSFCILERRSDVGGTWHIHTYPAIRSDSDALSFSLPPELLEWSPPAAKNGNTDERWFAEGYEIFDYLKAAWKKVGGEKNTIFNSKVSEMSFSSSEQQWTLKVEHCTDNANDGGAAAPASSRPPPPPPEIRCRFVFSCAGYYSYDSCMRPDFPGQASFVSGGGRIVHPQHWDNSLDYKGKKVCVIGSGATAVTIVPGMLEEESDEQFAKEHPRFVKKGPASHVVMLQRSPSWITPVSQTKGWPLKLGAYIRPYVSRALYIRLVGGVIVLYLSLMFTIILRFPNFARNYLKKAIRGALRRSGKEKTEEVMKQLREPKINPWQERLAADAQGALLMALASGKASVVTDRIKTFDQKGIQLESGDRINCDIIVTATGLNLMGRGGAKIIVDGKDMGPAANTVLYRGCLCNDIPNLVSVFGYFMFSWSLKSSLIAEYGARKVAACYAAGYGSFCPHADPARVEKEKRPITDLTSGYIARGKEHLPMQLDSWPWLMSQSYVTDYFLIGWAPTIDKTHVKYEPLSSEAKKTK